MFTQCPHCEQWVHLEIIACGIFRCGVYKVNGQPIPPHAPKVECDRLVQHQEIYGCGKPFRLEGDKVVRCEYI